MKILIIYQLRGKSDRNTIYEHLYSFKRHNSKHQFHYVNIFSGIPSFLSKINYDAVILHYTFLAGERFVEDESQWKAKINGLKQLSGYKIAIPQDEYDHTDRLCSLFKDIGVSAIFTCFEKNEDIKKAYPYDKTGVKKFFSVYTGYVEEKKLAEFEGHWTKYEERPIDIGYRARKLPAYFGRHGQLKYQLVEIFNEALIGRDFRTDIKNTNDSFVQDNVKIVKHGNEWYEFLLSSKAFIGCEGGSSLLDADGSIKAKVIQFTSEHPEATFDEIEEACFPGMDFNISCFALSPRHFESVMTKTLQILVEGNYGGIFKPWIHYIPLKKDFSNIDEVLDKLKDANFCQAVIDTAFTDIAISGKYTYDNFVSLILSDIENSTQTRTKISDFNFYFYHNLIPLRNRLLLLKETGITTLYNSQLGQILVKPYKRFIKPLMK